MIRPSRAELRTTLPSGLIARVTCIPEGAVLQCLITLEPVARKPTFVAPRTHLEAATTEEHLRCWLREVRREGRARTDTFRIVRPWSKREVTSFLLRLCVEDEFVDCRVPGVLFQLGE